VRTVGRDRSARWVQTCTHGHVHKAEEKGSTKEKAAGRQQRQLETQVAQCADRQNGTAMEAGCKPVTGAGELPSSQDTHAA